MKKLFNLMLIVAIGSAILLSGTGCASYMVYKESRSQVAMRKALITNNQQAIKSLQLGGDASGSGIAVTWMEAISERPWLQLGAGGVDALVAWGAYEGVKAIDGSNGSNSEDSKGNKANNNTSGENTTIVQGDGNTVTVSGSGGSGSGQEGQLPSVQP